MQLNLHIYRLLKLKLQELGEYECIFKSFLDNLVPFTLYWFCLYYMLSDPRGAGLQEALKLLSSVPTCPFRLVVSYTANIPRTTKIVKDSEPPIK